MFLSEFCANHSSSFQFHYVGISEVCRLSQIMYPNRASLICTFLALQLGFLFMLFGLQSQTQNMGCEKHFYKREKLCFG